MAGTPLTPDQLKSLELSSSSFLPAGDAIAPPHAFLSLSPTTSASYPTKTPPRSVTGSAIASPEVKTIDPIAVAGESKEQVVGGVAKERRSSSTVSSDSAGSVKQRFLKLGPVHWGESHDGEPDYVDVDV